MLVEELAEAISMFPDHLEVTINGVPRLNVAFDEVGLTGGWRFLASEDRDGPYVHHSLSRGSSLLLRE